MHPHFSRLSISGPERKPGSRKSMKKKSETPSDGNAKTIGKNKYENISINYCCNTRANPF